MSDFIDKSLCDRSLNHFTRRLRTSHLATTATVGFLALLLFATSFAQINSQGRYAAMIASGDRQRILAQRCVLFSLRLTQEADMQRRAELRDLIAHSLADLERIQRGLIEGDPALDLPGHPSAKIEALYHAPPVNLDKRLADFAIAVRRLAAQTIDAPLNPRSPDLLHVLEAVPGELLTGLDEAGAAYGHANHQTTRLLQALETLLVLLLLLTLFIELRFIFRPLMHAILHETREQTATRLRYNALLNTVGEAIITMDANNRILSVNSEAERVWREPARELIGRPINVLIVPGRNLSAEQWRASFPGDQRAQTVAMRRGGETFPLELRLTETTLDHAGSEHTGGSAKRDVRFFTICARDITIRVEADKRIGAARDAALDVARARSEFVANVSHELRTPMNGVLGAADLLGATSLNPEQHELLDTIRTSGDSLLTIINDILDFSKMEAGKMSLETIEIDLRQLVESTADVLAGRALQKHLELIAHIDPGVPTQLLGDPGRLRQVLLNLLGNALKFTKSGEIILRVRCEGVTDTHAHLRFEVRDTGCGIPLEAQQRLFRAFSQADESTARHFGGTGLGLTISRQIVELMGGTINVDSIPGEGSIFWFTAALARNLKAVDVTEADNPSVQAVRGLRVIVVDDNASLRSALQKRLVAWDMFADTAADAAHTLALMKEKAAAGTPYDAALLDLNLGSMDGFTLAWAIANQPELARTRLILVTSLGVESDRHACTQIGICGSITKPIKYHSLLNALARLVDNPDAVSAAEMTVAAALPLLTTATHDIPEKPVLHVLLAEDNAINRKLALRQLQNLGCTADSVENGLEALAALDAGDYDVVLLDMHMPVMDGCQAALVIRQHEAQLGRRRQTLIALTASAAVSDRERCLSSGMDDFLCKPVRQDELVRTLARWAPATLTPVKM